MLGLPTAAVAAQCDDLLQQDKSQQNTADEAHAKGDLKAGSECATADDKQSSDKKNEEAAEKLKSKGKVEEHTTGEGRSKK
jgi:hypothetical protein